uniref:Uncharacterized protein n=1 Tax=viral metagenome TaxID=1070528 RepID=A0A6C0CRA2_9ZZZZ
METHIVLFITCGFMSDRILKDVFSGDYEINYTGQVCGGKDDVLTNGVRHGQNFHVYYRENKYTVFTYLGQTQQTLIEHERMVPKGYKANEQQCLKIRLYLEKQAVNNEPILRHDNETFKRAALTHAGLSANCSVFTGIYELQLLNI